MTPITRAKTLSWGGGARALLLVALVTLAGPGLAQTQTQTGVPQDSVTATTVQDAAATDSAVAGTTGTAAEVARGAAVQAATDAASLTTSEKRQQAYYSAWLDTARRAELAIDANRASNAALEQLRAELVSYRQTFMSERDKNSARIATLQAQVNALGPAPEEGKTEAVDIAALRSSLNDQLATLKVPALVAQEAYSRADGLISEIDRIIRDRQKRQLLSRGESPLTLTAAMEAVSEFNGFLRDMRNETVNSWRTARDLQRLRSNLPLILLLSAVGLLLLLRGVAWAERAGETLGRLAGRGVHVGGFVVSLGRIALPQVGLFLLTRAVHASEAVGLRGTMLLNLLPVWGITIFGFMWLGERLYSRNDREAIIPLSVPARAAMRRNMLIAALVMVLYGLVSVIETVQNISVSTRAVMMLPVILAASWLLMRVRKLTLLSEQEGQAIPAGLRRVASTFRVLTLIIAIEAPLMAAIGYQALAEAVIFPAIMSLAVLGVVLVLQRFISDTYAWLSGKGEAVEETIVPALAGFVLALVSLPVLALIWGARPTDLTELWSRFLAGFTIGDTTISPTDFLTFAVIFAIGYVATRALQGALKGSLLPRTSLDAGGQNAVVSGVGYVGIIASALLAITLAGINLSSLAIVAGALSVGIGFGLQNIVSNFVSGIILLIERPISEGDWIEVNGQMGYVRDISVRSTRIETFDRTDLIVPNADLVSGMVTNYTRGNTVGRVIVPVGVAYGTDTRRVEGILRDIANRHPMVLANPAPNVVFQGFGADALNFEIRAILRDVNWVLSVKSDMNHEIAKRFGEEGIEIPFAQRDIWLRNPETLRAAVAPTAPAAQPAAGGVAQAPAPSRQPVPMQPEDLDAPEAETDGEES